jgi:predicted RNA-binding Zn-ribbon protein involved in translation (DUF1610 family)
MTAIYVIIGIIALLALLQLFTAVYNAKTIWACPMCGASIKKAWHELLFKALAGTNHIRVVKLTCPNCKQTGHCKPSIKNDEYR